jgi:hypothetical protein
MVFFSLENKLQMEEEGSKGNKLQVEEEGSKGIAPTVLHF